jgi:membrane fusion protein, multidrug efflux system
VDARPILKGSSLRTKGDQTEQDVIARSGYAHAEGVATLRGAGRRELGVKKTMRSILRTSCRRPIAVALTLLAGCSHHPVATVAPEPHVSVVTVKAQAVPIVTELPGRVDAYRTADVRPQVSGIILRRLFVEGGEVKKGQQLYQIDPAPYQAAYDSAVAARASARALAERYKQLVGGNLVSKQDYDNAVAARLQADAAVETAHINLVYTKVLSPISGRIGRSFVTEGALITADQATALATVQELEPIYVDVTQPTSTLLRLEREAAAGLLKQSETGKPQVRLQLEDGTDYAHPGTLEFSEVTVDEGTGSVTRGDTGRCATGRSPRTAAGRHSQSKG